MPGPEAKEILQRHTLYKPLYRYFHMSWKENKSDYCEFEILETGYAEIGSAIEVFWKLYAKDVLQRLKPEKWNYIAITIRALDGNFGFFPEHTERDGLQGKRGFLYIFKMQEEIYAIDDSEEKHFDAESDVVNQKYSKLLTEAARAVDLAGLVNRKASGLLLRIKDFADAPPVLEVVLN